MDFRRKSSTAGALILLSCLVQAWTISRAVVPAQDCVRYLIVAQGFERDGFAATLRVQPEQPLFPALVWLVHQTSFALGWLNADNWAICLQIAAAIPLVLSVIPVFALFCRLHGDRAGLIGAVLYCLLGGIARLGADGLSDSTHLALFCTALWAAARYFPVDGKQYGSSLWLLLCGCSTGLALMTRGEAIVVPVAVLATLGLLQIVGRHRTAWTQALRGGGAFSFGLVAVAAPYLACCDAMTPQAAIDRLLGRQGAAEAAPLNDFDSSIKSNSIEPHWELPGVGLLAFGKKDTSTSGRFHGYLAAVGRSLHELAQTLHYWLGALALIGLWSARRTLVWPLDRFMQCLCAILMVASIYVAAHAGYLSARHLLLLVVLGVGWAGAGTVAIADWLGSRRFAHIGDIAPPMLRTIAAFAVCLICGLDCLPPLHESRAAHREAARWLNENADRSVAVLDSRGWTALYTGRKTYRYEAAQSAFSDPALAYVVVEQAELATNSRRGETMRLLLDRAGEPVARFASADSEKHSVVIHRWRPERFQELGVQSYAR